MAPLNEQGLDILLAIATTLASNPRFHRPAIEVSPPRPFRLLRTSTPRPPLPLVEPLTGAYFLCSKGGSVSMTSPDLLRWLDTTDAQLQQEGWFRFIDGDEERRRIGGLWLIAAQVGDAFCYTVRCKTALGRIAWAFVRVKPCLHPITAAVEGFLGTVHPQVLPARVLRESWHTA